MKFAPHNPSVNSNFMVSPSLWKICAPLQ